MLQTASTPVKRHFRMRERQVVLIPIEAIRPNPHQPRRTFDQEALEELSRSIKQYGLLQPISVRRAGNDRYELIAGERRLRACRMAGLTKIDAIVYSAYEQDSAILAMMENLQRENLHFMEEAEGYQKLIRDHGLSQDELAKRLGKNQSTIANKMRILKLPLTVKKLIVKHCLTERHSRALLRLHDERTQLEVVKAIIDQGLNVKASEDLVERAIGKLYGIEKEPKGPGRQLTSTVKDARLYVNSIQGIIQKMNDAGLSPKFEQRETDLGLELTLTIPKGV